MSNSKAKKHKFKDRLEQLTGILVNEPDSLTYLERKIKEYGVNYRNTFYPLPYGRGWIPKESG